MRTQECVGSGLCCKTGPCAFGEWDAELHQCKFLEVKDTINGVEIYQCGIYDEICGQPGAEYNPAFGTGCCMGMFNENREKIISLGITNYEQT
jgi:hypothetical protein